MGRQGLVLARDAWHSLDCYPVGAPFADFAFISEARTERELAELEDLTRCRHSDVVDLRASREVEVRVLEPDAVPAPG